MSSPGRRRPNYLRVVARLVRREGGRDPAASGHPDVVLAATLGAELRPDMHTRILTARADTADSQRLAKASSHISGTAAVDLASDSLDSGATSRREPAPPIALVGASLGHQALATRVQACRRSTSLCSSAQVLLMQHLTSMISFYSILSSMYIKVVESQPMSQIDVSGAAGHVLGTLCVHSGQFW